VGTVLDTTVFIEFERATRGAPAEHAIQTVSQRLEEHLDADEEVAIASITVSELLHGVHRANEQHRVRREAFVEAILAAFPSLPFDLLAARTHARLWASLASTGADIGAHDRIVAATAVSIGWRIASANTRHFERVPGLNVTPIALG
jgi:tRNA(fMet)-specific endonuclease VapC